MSMESIAFMLFISLFAGAGAGEALWLSHNAWAKRGRAAAYVLISDLLGFGIAAFVFAVCASLLVASAYPFLGSGPLPNSDFWTWVVVIVGLVFPPLLFFLIKRVWLSLFKIQYGKAAWVYSLYVTLFFFAVLIIPQVVLIYLA